MSREQDYIDLGFDTVEVYQGCTDKLCRACDQDITNGDRVRVRTTTDDPNLGGLYHEACADEVVLEYQEDK
jgi:hypothetical protein